VITRRRYAEHPPRYEYLLTDAGKEHQPMLLALKEWDDRHCNPGAEPIIFRHTCGADFHPLTVCAACRAPLRDGELTVTGGTHLVQATM
jgi:HxlR-like helix-turn-helix